MVVKVREPDVKEITSEHEHAGVWRVRLRQVWQNHRWVIAEINVGPAGALPVGGLTSRDFDLVRPATLAWEARGRTGTGARGGRASPRKWSGEQLDFLQRYVALVKAGERAPSHVLAEEFAIAPRAVHNRLSRLRNYGLLSRPGPGAPGGDITAKGRAAIRSAARMGAE